MRQAVHRTLALAFLGGALLPFALRAQDLAALCQSLQKVKVGQWATYAVHGGQLDGSRSRLAVVGSERQGDSTLYWIEINHTSEKNPAQNGVVQVLVPAFGLETTAIKGLILKAGSQPAMRMPAQMLPLVTQQVGQTNSVLGIARRCAQAQSMGWDSVSVPAGAIRALHVKDADGEAWLSPDIPFGLVKLTIPGGVETVLTGRGSDAKSSITEAPQLLPG